MVPRDRIELPSARCKRAALPLDERGTDTTFILAPRRGIEPRTN
jgi:hypothetical protein